MALLESQIRTTTCICGVAAFKPDDTQRNANVVSLTYDGMTVSPPSVTKWGDKDLYSGLGAMERYRRQDMGGRRRSGHCSGRQPRLLG